MWDLYMKFLQSLFTPTEVEVMQLILVGAAAKGLLSGIKWSGLSGFDFNLLTAKAWGQTLVSALTSIGFHEASKTGFIEDIKKLVDMILEKLGKKKEPPRV
jgi:hypothetical protein